MKTEPNIATDTIAFLTKPDWPTAVYWIALLASIFIAVRAWRDDPGQRGFHAAGIWALRVLIGTMWWQGSLWKIPPNYAGLLYFMKEVVDHAAIPLQRTLYANLFIPNINLFGPLIYLTEAVIALSLIVGVFTRWFALLGLLMAGNLWLGLYSAPGEWPWTYGYLMVIQALFILDPPGRCLGLDARWTDGSSHDRARLGPLTTRA
ncbi:hypothetical protein [Rhodopila sp.]|uniref:hypothetical protein n=1 Tax=Rhodopila sp. TaxID=2480087 RepID=UPI003D105876